MKLLVTLGIIAGGFLMSPPPKSVLATLAWVVSRSHPVVATLMVLAVVSAWRRSDD